MFKLIELFQSSNKGTLNKLGNYIHRWQNVSKSVQSFPCVENNYVYNVLSCFSLKVYNVMMLFGDDLTSFNP